MNKNKNYGRNKTNEKGARNKGTGVQARGNGDSGKSVNSVFCGASTFMDSTNVNPVIKANTSKLIKTNRKINADAMRCAFQTPNLMGIEYAPTLGYTTGWNDMINRAWMSIYNSYASKTTGTIPFGFMDLAMMTQATDSIVILISEAIRAYQIATCYAVLDAEAPKSWLKTLCCSESWMEDRDWIRTELNRLIRDFNSLNLPVYLDVIHRRKALASNVYYESADVTALTPAYAFISNGFYVYDDENSICDYVSWDDYILNGHSVTAESHFQDGVASRSTSLRDPDDYFSLIRSLISILRSSGAYHQVSSAVIRAFGDAGTAKFEYVNDDGQFGMKYDPTILIAIMNAHFMDYLQYNHISQGVVENTLKCQPCLSVKVSIAQRAGSVATGCYRGVNINLPHNGAVTNEMVMAALSLQQKISEGDLVKDSDPVMCTVRSLTEIPMGLRIFSPAANTVYNFSPYFGTTSNMLEFDMLTSRFKFRPPMHVVALNGDNYEVKATICSPSIMNVIDETTKLMDDAFESALDSAYSVSQIVSVV